MHSDATPFQMPLTAFQQRVLEVLLARSGIAPVVVQHPYAHPVPGEANQYMTAEWPSVATIYLYDTEIGFEDFTFERQEYPTDDEQLAAMTRELDGRFSEPSD